MMLFGCFARRSVVQLEGEHVSFVADSLFAPGHIKTISSQGIRCELSIKLLISGIKARKKHENVIHFHVDPIFTSFCYPLSL